MSVTAKDKGTGKQQNIRIEAGSGLSKDEIEKMKNDAKANEEEDKKMRERIEKLNQADGLIFNSEKQLKEYGDKISGDKKAAIESALATLKEAHKEQNIDSLDSAIEALNNAWTAASEEMYAAQQQAGGQADANAGGAQEGNNGTSDVADAEYEEVK